MNKYTLSYQYATYSGTLVVWADDEDEAIALLKKRLAPHMGLPMAYFAVRVVSVEGGYE